MCAIFGIIFMKGHKLHNNNAFSMLVNNLMLASQMRGRDATGLAFVQENKVVIKKKNVEASVFAAMPSTKRFMMQYGDVTKIDGPDRLKIVMGHCRQKTKGTPENKQNNHPIITPRIIGTHNGIIHNDDMLFDRFGASAIRRRGQVDSEIIFQLVDYYANHLGFGTLDGIKKTVAMLNGSFACSFVNKRDGDVIWLFRKHNPTTVLFYKKINVIIYSTSKDYIIDSVKKLGIDISQEFGPYHELPYPENSGLAFNVRTKRGLKFEISPMKEVFVGHSPHRKPAMAKEGSVFGIGE